MLFHKNDDLALSNHQAQVIKQSLDDSVITGENFYTPRLSSVAEELQRILGIIKPLVAAKDQAIYLNILFENYSYQDWLRANQEFGLLYDFLTEYTKSSPENQNLSQQTTVNQAREIIAQTNDKLQQQLDNLLIQAQNLFASERIQQWVQLQQQLAYVDLMHQVSIIIEQQNKLLQEEQQIGVLLTSSSLSPQEREALIERQNVIKTQLAEIAPIFNIAKELSTRYEREGANFNINDYKDHFVSLQTAANKVRENLSDDEEAIENLKDIAPNAYEELHKINTNFKAKIQKIDEEFIAQKEEIQEKLEELGNVPQEIARDMNEATLIIEEILSFPKDLLENLNDEQRTSLQTIKESFRDIYIPQIASSTNADEVNDLFQQCRTTIQSHMQQANLRNLANSEDTYKVFETLEKISSHIDKAIPPVSIDNMPQIPVIPTNVEIPSATPVVTPLSDTEVSFISDKQRYQQILGIAEAMMEVNSDSIVDDLTNIETDIPLVEATNIEKEKTDISEKAYKKIQSFVSNIDKFLAEIKEINPELHTKLSDLLSTFNDSLTKDEMCQDDYENLTSEIDKADKIYPNNRILDDINNNINEINELIEDKPSFTI